MPHMNLKRAQEVMKRRKVDGLIASTYHNIYYTSGFTGYKMRTSGRPFVTIVPADSAFSPVLIVDEISGIPARLKSYIEDIRTYPAWQCMANFEDVVQGRAKRPANVTPQVGLESTLKSHIDILQEKGLQAGTIGIEENLFNSSAYQLLLKQYPKVKFVEAESIFWELRKIKSGDEIAALRLAAELGEKGIQAVTKGHLIGTTISELQCKYKMGVLEASSGYKEIDLEFLHAMISSGDHSTVELPGYRVAKGDILYIDNGVIVAGYNSDMSRTFSVGKPSNLHKSIYQALKTGYEEGLSNIKPGMKMKELYRIIHETINTNGLEWFARGAVGHMVGIGPGSIEQPPKISATEEAELEPNMVMTIEVGVYVMGSAAFNIEDVILVTSQGHELFTKLPRDLIEL
jgi:Xaa-Pro dipeptidase